MCYCALQPWSIRTKLKSLKSLSIISIVLGTLLNSVHPIHHRQPLLNSLAPEGKKRKHYMQKLAVMLMQRVYNLLSTSHVAPGRQKDTWASPFLHSLLKLQLSTVIPGMQLPRESSRETITLCSCLLFFTFFLHSNLLHKKLLLVVWCPLLLHHSYIYLIFILQFVYKVKPQSQLKQGNQSWLVHATRKPFPYTINCFPNTNPKPFLPSPRPSWIHSGLLIYLLANIRITSHLRKGFQQRQRKVQLQKEVNMHIRNPQTTPERRMTSPTFL